MSFSIAAASPVVARAQLSRPTAARRAAPLRAAAKDGSKVEVAIDEAKAACADGSTAECAAAWDVVEEVSAGAADAKGKAAVRSTPGEGEPRDKQPRANKVDPLEAYCETDPSADECRVYSD